MSEVNQVNLTEIVLALQAQLAALTADKMAAEQKAIALENERLANEERERIRKANDGLEPTIHALGFPCLAKPLEPGKEDSVFRSFRVDTRTVSLWSVSEFKDAKGKTVVQGPRIVVVEPSADLVDISDRCAGPILHVGSGATSTKLRDDVRKNWVTKTKIGLVWCMVTQDLTDTDTAYHVDGEKVSAAEFVSRSMEIIGKEWFADMESPATKDTSKTPLHRRNKYGR